MNNIKHIAIIMDGNGRWAAQRKMSRARGHFAGARNAFDIVRAAHSKGIATLSLFAFSKENWGRPQMEVNLLMRLLARSLEDQIPFFAELGLRLKVIGDRAGLPASVSESIARAEESTAGNSGMNLLIAVNYSGQHDICQAVDRMRAAPPKAGAVSPADFQKFLLTSAYDPPDLVIRSGGENRLSNFFLWQAAYAEIYFEEKFWPDFDAEDLDRHIRKFLKTERRFGKTGDQIAGR